MDHNNLFINYLSEIIWNNASAEIYTDPALISVWKVKVSDFTADLAFFKSLLSTQELEKAMRYQQENDQNHRIIGRAVLRILLSRYLKITPQEIRFSKDLNHKPVLENSIQNQIQFNVSHSGDYILITFSFKSVGADLEKINTSFTWQNLLSFSFNRAEAGFIENSSNPNQSFYQLWTRKESLLKATGKGLTDDLAAIPSLDGFHQMPSSISKTTESWQISSFFINENHVGSVAFYPVKTVLQFFNFQL